MRTLLVVVLAVIGWGNARAAEPDLVVAYETGPAYILQNDGQYGATGTRFGAGDVGQRDNLLLASRTSAELSLGRHTAILLYAPFEARTQVKLASDLQFRDELFTAGTIVDHRYLFDGYRGSYLYRAVDRAFGGRLGVDVGGSLQIRNAEVSFVSGDAMQRAEQADIGVVFAAKARAWWRPLETRAWAMVDADAFSTFGLVPGVKGAIYDVQLAAGYPVARGIDVTLGARLLGGGADVASREIYNWANFVTFTAGLRIAIDEVARPATP